MALSVFGFSLTIFFWLRKFVTYQIAATVALLQLVNGRVLFYETLYGLIDITYSWVNFSAFMVIYSFDKKKKYWSLFIFSYLLTTLGFMMKGLPSLAFQGITLGVWLGYQRKWKILLHPAHFVGIFLFYGLISTYYIMSVAQFDFPLDQAIQVLFKESIKRTGLVFGWEATILHILSFPFEFVFHFLPFTLFGVLFYRPKNSKSVASTLAVLSNRKPDLDTFLMFIGLVFIANLLIYWVSPQVYARYTLMLVPLLFTLLIQAYYEQLGTWQQKSLEVFMGVVMLLATFGVWIAVGVKATQNLPGIEWICALSMLCLGVCCYFYRKQVQYRLDIFIVFLLVARISFNFLFIPPRAEKRLKYQRNNEAAALLTMDGKGKALPLFSYCKTIGDDGATDVNSFHISAKRRHVLRMTSSKIPGAYYLADSINLVGEHYTELGKVMLYPDRLAKIIRFDSTSSK